MKDILLARALQPPLSCRARALSASRRWSGHAMARLSSVTQRLRHALECEQLLSQLDHDAVEFFARELAEEEEVDDSRFEELVESLEPYLQNAQQCRAVLTRFLSLPGAVCDCEADSAEVTQAALFFEIRHASASSSAPPPSPGPEASTQDTNGKHDEVWGLSEWLRRLSLLHYAERARAWCKVQGARDVEEVMEFHAEFCRDLQLKELERNRVAQDSQDVMRRTSADMMPGEGAAAAARVAAGKPAQPKAGMQRAEAKNGSAEASRRPGLFRAESFAGVAAAARKTRRETFGPEDNPYVLNHEVGAGTFATVYTCTRGDMTFAAKAITVSRLCRQTRNEKQARERLHRETQILYSMRHKHVVSLYDVVETKDKLYLVMEYMDGGELWEWMKKHEKGALLEHQARYVFVQIVLGLRYIHAKGIVHRDLKPQNILVDRRASRPPDLIEVKISDFGQSKLVNDGYDIARTQVGTPLFCAPEVDQYKSTGYDQTVDLWSLGVLLYVMLEGRPPDNFPEVSARSGSEGLFTGATRMAKDARDLVQRLVRTKPAERLPLDACLVHQFVVMRNGPLSKVLMLSEGADRILQGERERLAVLPRDPKDVTRLKRELQELTLQFQVPAFLRVGRQVALCYSHATSQEQLENAWQELGNILRGHFPKDRIEHQDVGAYVCPGLMTVDEAADAEGSPTAAEEPQVAVEATEAPSAPSSDGAASQAEEEDALGAVGESGGPCVGCGRVCMTNDLHDEKRDKDRFAVSRGAPVRTQSVYAHLSKVGSGNATGFLSFGKPGVLVFEGRVDDVSKMINEVKRIPGWFGAKEMWFDKTGVQDVDTWRSFRSFAKVRFEELEGLFTATLQRPDVFEEFVLERPCLNKTRASRAKQKM